MLEIIFGTYKTKTYHFAISAKLFLQINTKCGGKDHPPCHGGVKRPEGKVSLTILKDSCHIAKLCF